MPLPRFRQEKLILALLSALATNLAARAQEAPAAPASPPLGWSATAEFSLVAATGNAEAQTLGFKGALKDQLDGATLLFETGALDAESTSRTRFAIRNPDGSVTLGALDETKQTAEAYFFRGRYNSVSGNGWGWFAGPAGRETSSPDSRIASPAWAESRGSGSSAPTPISRPTRLSPGFKRISSPSRPVSTMVTWRWYWVGTTCESWVPRPPSPAGSSSCRISRKNRRLPRRHDERGRGRDVGAHGAQGVVAAAVGQPASLRRSAPDGSGRSDGRRGLQSNSMIWTRCSPRRW